MNTAHLMHAFPQSGEVLLEKYAVDGILGEGGMGAVLKAEHLLRRVPVALKFIHPNVIAIPGAVERFYNEAVAASRIANEHVVQILDVDRLPNGVPFIVMEFLAGHDLAGAIDSVPNRTLSVPRAVHITIQILRALSVAHRAGVVHRDMKPSNVFLVDRDGDADFVKLVDFGISKVRTGNGPGEAVLTQVNSTLGTPLYMAPEQARSAREVDARSDLYSVAVILYEMLAGRTPFVAETGELTEILYKLFTSDPPSIREFRDDLDPALIDVIERGMKKDPLDRFESAGEFAAELAVFADGRSQNELQRMRQAELAAGSRASEMLEGVVRGSQQSVRVHSGVRLTSNDSFSATQLGTEVGQSGPILVGRGNTEALSSPPEAPGAAPLSTASSIPKWMPAAGLVFLALAAIAFIALRPHAAASNAAAPPPEPRAVPVVDSQAARIPAAAAPLLEVRDAGSAVVGIRVENTTISSLRPRAPAPAAPPASAPKSPPNAAGKPRLNELGIAE